MDWEKLEVVMKKRTVAVLLSITMLGVVSGCAASDLKALEEDLEAAAELASEIASELDSAEVVTEEVEADQSAEESFSLEDVYVTEYSKENGLFACDSDEFYENLLLATIDAELVSKENGDTLESLSNAWNDKINTTVESLKESPMLTDDDIEKLDTLMSQWSDFDPRYQLYWLKMYGPNGKIMGSMYTECMVDQAEYEYEIFAGSLMALEYEVNGYNELNLELLTEDTDISDANRFEFYEYLVCMEPSQEFRDAVEECGILDMGEIEMRRLAIDIADVAYKCSGDDADGSPYVVNHELVSRKLADLESGLCDDSEGVSARKKERSKLLALEMMNIQYLMLNDVEVQYEEYVNDDKDCYHVALQRKEEVEGEYRHVFDYFFVNGTYLGVSYPSKSAKMDLDRYVFDACDFEVDYVDVTFDGNKDIVISLGHQGNVGTMVHCAFVYEDGLFEYVKSFESIPNYSINESDQCIEGEIGGTVTRYVYEGGEFKNVD